MRCKSYVSLTLYHHFEAKTININFILSSLESDNMESSKLLLYISSFYHLTACNIFFKENACFVICRSKCINKTETQWYYPMVLFLKLNKIKTVFSFLLHRCNEHNKVFTVRKHVAAILNN